MVGLISGSIAYFDKCYCPGKDPFLNRNAPLREKMYQLKTEYTSQNLQVKYRPGIVVYDAKIQILLKIWSKVDLKGSTPCLFEFVFPFRPINCV